MAQAEATLAVIQDPDSPDEPEQEPGEPAGEPSPSEDATASEDTPAAEDEATAEQPADASAAPADGPARDEQGRFAPKEPKATPAAEVAPSTPAPSPAESSPFSFRVDGLTVEVEGATISGDTITMPKKAWDSVVQNRVADRGKIQQREERQVSRIRQLESEATAREERFKTVLSKVDALFADPNRIKAFWERYEQEAPRFKLEVENALLKAGQTRHETDAKTRASEADEREFSEQAPNALGNAVDLVIDRIAKGQQVDRNAIVTELQELWDSGVPIFFRVTEGDGSGLDPREHKWGVDLARVERLAKPYISLHQKQTATKTAANVEAANRAATGKGPAKAAPPPVAPASGSPTPGGEAQYPTTREEYLKWKARRSEEVGLPL